MLSMLLDINIPNVPFHGHPLGIDLGLDKFIATSDGELVAKPRFLNQLHRKLKLLQRSYQSVKQEILNVSLRIPRYTA
jgi:putative transposase